MMIRAVCLRCGGVKAVAPAKCAKCGFVPESSADLAKSFIMSAQFDIGEKTFGRSPPDLALMAKDLAAGAPLEFDAAEVAEVEAEVVAFRALRPRSMFLDLVKWLGPPIVILVVVFALLKFK